MSLKSGVGDGWVGENSMGVSPGSGSDLGAGIGLTTSPMVLAAWKY